MGKPGWWRLCVLIDAYGGGEAFQVLALQPGGLPLGGGLVRYSAEFALVS
jgi:hypothetical protein